MARRSQKLSERQTRIMQFLTDFQESHGYSPSIREIGDHIDVKSTSLVDYYLRQLEELSYIRRDGRVSRSICVLQPVHGTVGGKVVQTVREAGSALRDLVNVPLLGRIVASEPIPMPTQSGGAPGYFDPESSVEVARSMLPGRERIDQLFALEVQGDSMIDAMINDGDIVYATMADDVRSHEVAVVQLEGALTLRRVYKNENQIVLMAENPAFAPVVLRAGSNVRILGKAVAFLNPNAMESPF